MAYAERTNACCRNCGTIHLNVPVERDEDGYAYPDIGMSPCHADDCTKDLCNSCPQFVCACCDLAHCEEHRSEFRGASLCPDCMKYSRKD